MIELEVLHCDNHLLVVHKPAGVLSQGDETGDPDLLSIAREWVKTTFDKPGEAFLGLVHRLDRPVSGVMVFARTSKAASRLSDQFRRREADKRYLALVEGAIQGSGRRQDFLLKDDRHVRIVSESTPGAKMAAMKWEALDSSSGRSLVRVILETGRSHQIRVQLAAMGSPIIGDLRYGARTELDGRNLALHAYELGFLHPTRRERMQFVRRPPASWGEAFASAIEAVVEGSR
jgi:23S rRNA pseudouridine1911/1915/1917 synthase